METNRTPLALDIAPDAMEDLMDLPVRFVPDADRLLQKLAGGSWEAFTDRAKESNTPGIFKVDRKSGKATIRMMVATSPETSGHVPVVVTSVKVKK